MDITKCTKYIDFLSSECDRFLKNRKVTEEEVLKMRNELLRFKDLTNASGLSPEIIKRVNELNLTYEVSEKSEYFKVLALATLGYWYIIYENRKARKMENCMHDFKGQVSELSLFLKLNFN